MMILNDIYKCSVCGNIVEVVHVGGGTLVCCGENMDKIEPNTVDASVEKHIPVVEKTDTGFKVKVGSVPHPMETAHYIEWIEVMTSDDKVGRKYLKPGDLPEAEFYHQEMPKSVRIYCNLHGLWSKN
ncbi:MAG: desulfoferrodoxin [Candidatus Berkelbacteria bacterium]